MNHGMRKTHKLFKLLMVLVIAGVLGAVVMVLWNWILPGLYFGISSIDYWHALGLLVLSRILFGGFRGHGGWHERHGWNRWQRWQAMTPQEREQFCQNRADMFRHKEG